MGKQIVAEVQWRFSGDEGLNVRREELDFGHDNTWAGPNAGEVRDSYIYRPLFR